VVDIVVGCGDLDPEYLGFVADAFRAPLLYVRGNHDRGALWDEPARLPEPLESRAVETDGLRILGLSWPGDTRGRAIRDENAAWFQVLSCTFGAMRKKRPMLVLSHVPPRGLGDVDDDPYHLGFRAYRWLLDRLQPPLWLHGHTPVPVTGPEPSHCNGTTLVNVTGAVLLDLEPAA
jgi:Icc-related predicted phosphoesterase